MKKYNFVKSEKQKIEQSIKLIIITVIIIMVIKKIIKKKELKRICDIYGLISSSFSLTT